MVDQQPAGQIKGFAGEVVGRNDGLAEEKDHGGEGNDHAVGDGQQPQRVFFGLLCLPGADTAAHNDDHGCADGGAGNVLQRGDGQGRGIGGDLGRAEGGDQALGHHAAQLEHSCGLVQEISD